MFQFLSLTKIAIVAFSVTERSGSKRPSDYIGNEKFMFTRKWFYSGYLMIRQYLVGMMSTILDNGICQVK